jgi:transposase
MRAVMNGVMYILSTGCQWRYIPKDFPPRSTLHDYFTWWICDGTLDRIHYALYVECREKVEREASPTACIIDSQSVKSAEKGGLYRSSWVRCGQANQGQETAYPRRHARSVAARDRSFRRCSGSRRWHLVARHVVRPISVSRETVSPIAFTRDQFSIRRSPGFYLTSKPKSSNAAIEPEGSYRYPGVGSWNARSLG